MNKILVIAGVVALIFLTTWQYVKRPQNDRSSFGGTGQSLPLCASDNLNFSTTTRRFVSTTASSTVSCYSARADKIDLDLMVEASTTATQFQWQYEFSDNGIDWYPESGQSVDTVKQVTHGATAVVHKWTPNITATTSLNFSLPIVASPYFRTIFGAGAANGSFSAKFILREEIK